MIRFTLIPAFALLAATPSLAAERSYALSGFDKVALGGSDSAVVRRGDFAVRAIGEQADLDRLDVKVEQGTLKIGRKKGNWDWRSKGVRVEVSLPMLTAAAVGGSGSITADRGGGAQFNARVGGSGNLEVAAVDAAAVSVGVGGSGNIKLGGRCTALDLRIGGSGDADLSNLKCSRAEVGIGGSGDASLHVSDTANIRMAGSGDVTVAGGARCVSKVAGSGTIRCN